MYVSFDVDDCPKVPFFRYLWFYHTCFSNLFIITLYNFKFIEFGKLLEFFNKLFLSIRYIPSSVMLEYNISYIFKYNKYLDFINTK